MTDKIQVKVFLPAGACSCSQTGFLGRIYEIVRKYRDSIDYIQDSAASEEAQNLGITYRGVLIGNHLLKTNPTQTQIEEVFISELEKEKGRISV